MLQPSRLPLAAFIVAFGLTACGGGGSTPHVPTGVGGGSPVPVNPPGGGTFDAAAFTCPSSDTATSTVRSGGSVSEGAVRRFPVRTPQAAPQLSGLIAVTYDRSAATTLGSSLATPEQGAGASLVRTLDFPHIGLMTRVLSVAPNNVANVEASLRGQPGVRSVGPAGGGRYPLSVAAPYYTNDPYFNGFSTTAAPNPTATAPPPTYHVPPYDENASVPGQWGMHAIRLEDAYAYSRPNNGSGIIDGNALGSAGIKIAIIDTGADTTHPELNSKIVYQKCFITNPSGVQSTGNFTTDLDGHGTDVAGIAAAASDNGLGFTGSGGRSVIYDYRVEPTPNDTCAPGANPPASDQQCSIAPIDIASAITDAVANRVNVISMSLGGDTCPKAGQDPAPVEGNAVANAIAANIIVVAASGNGANPGGSAPVSAPACDAGVIAAGATALADGQPNGDGNSNGSAAAPIEYVASYSSSGSPGALFGNPSAWGIVAPGGDPNPAESRASNPTPVDDLHWIENITTGTPYDSKFGVVPCSPDYDASPGSTPDCRVLIAGTSMSAPMVAGVAALIVGVNPAYQPPSAMKQLLCSTADDIADPREGCGRLNIYRAMAKALGDPKLP